MHTPLKIYGYLGEETRCGWLQTGAVDETRAGGAPGSATYSRQLDAAVGTPRPKLPVHRGYGQPLFYICLF